MFNRIPVRFGISFLFYVLLLLLFYFVIISYHEILNYIEWGDESETIVAAKMMINGYKLYSQIFNHHGPFTFFLGYIVELFSDGKVEAYRMLIVILQCVILFEVIVSKVWESLSDRLFIIAILGYFYVDVMPSFFGHMFQYQTICGLFISLVFIGYIVPIAVDRQVSRVRETVYVILISCFFFISVSYVFLSVFLFLSTLTKNNYKRSIFISLLSVVFFTLLLNYLGSIEGYYAYHIYLNSKILPMFAGHSFVALLMNVFNTIFDLSWYSLLFFLSIVVLYLVDSSKIKLRTIFILLAILSTMTRGGTSFFQLLPYYYYLSILPLVLVIFILKINVRSRKFIYIPILTMLSFNMYMTNYVYHEYENNKLPTYSPFSEIVTAYTEPQDRIIAFTFHNIEYLLSNRIPASGSYFYFPWQEYYDKNNIFDISNDPCIDIEDNKPKVMMIDKSLVWDRFTWDSYGECINDVLQENYTNYFGGNVYFLNSFISNLSDLSNDFPIEMRAIYTQELVNTKFGYKVNDHATDPYVIFDIIDIHSFTKNDFFRVKVNSDDSDVFNQCKAQIFWSYNNKPYSQVNSVYFNVNKQVNIITKPYSARIHDDKMSKIVKVRIDLDNCNGKEVSMELY